MTFSTFVLIMSATFVVSWVLAWFLAPEEEYDQGETWSYIDEQGDLITRSRLGGTEMVITTVTDKKLLTDEERARYGQQKK